MPRILLSVDADKYMKLVVLFENYDNPWNEVQDALKDLLADLEHLDPGVLETYLQMKKEADDRGLSS